MFTENNEELELQEHIEDGIEYSEIEDIKTLEDGDALIDAEELGEGFSEEDEEMIDDEEDELEDSEELFEDDLIDENDIND